MVDKIRYCRDCGAFIPAWSDKCLSCGYDDLKKRNGEHTIDLAELDGGAVIKSPYGVISKAYIANSEATYIAKSDGGHLISVQIRIVGEI